MSETEAPKKALLVVGNVLDGLTFYGPFESFDEAVNFGHASFGVESYVVTDLLPPESYSEEP